MTKFYIGTSGWQYWDWKGNFYPADIKSQDYFNFYQTKFDTVEINTTFYHFPKEQTIQKWKDMAGKGFVYAVKVWKRITHLKRLTDVKEDLYAFFDRVSQLGRKLGPLLYQLPPSYKFNLEHLGRFLKQLSKDFCHVIEFRHNSWWSPKTYKLLERYKVGLVLVSAPGIKSPFNVVTGDVAYYRFHGAEQWYVGNYSPEQMDFFVQNIKEVSRKVKQVYAYFDNTAGGAAPADAITLREKLGCKFKPPVVKTL